MVFVIFFHLLAQDEPVVKGLLHEIFNETHYSVFFSFPSRRVESNSTQQSGDVIRSDSRVAQGSFVPGVLLVKFKDEVPARLSSANGLKKVGVTTVDALLEKYQTRTIGKLFPTAQPLAQKKLFKTHTGQTFEQPNLHNIYKIELTRPS